MTKADAHPTPNPNPSPQDLYGASLAAAEQARSSCPSVLDLGQHLADVENAYEAFELAHESDAPGNIKVAATWAMGLLREREDALRSVISTQPALTIADAAVQIAVIAEMADWVSGSDAKRAEALVLCIEKMALGILPILASAAGLDLDRMHWAYCAGQMRIARFRGLGMTQ